MAVKFSNNAYTSLASTITAGATSFSVASAATFPTLGAGDWTYVSLTDEVVKVTAISGTTFTCDAVSGGHSSGINIELRMTAELLNDFAEDTEALPIVGGALTGAVTTNSTFDGRDVATDGTKLDTVETNADVTDVTNVTAAGALMDSEVTNLAAVKAFATTDYATAAQGTTADAALPKAGGALTGAVTTTSTFDGVDIATRDGVLTTTTNTANAALPKAGGAMTGAITTSSTFDGRDVSVDGAKLDGIEASADVTDTANVVAALSAGTGVTISGAGVIAVSAVALTTVQTAVDQTAQLALTAQEGDVVVRSDENKSYVHNGGTAGTMADYTLLATPTDAVLSVNGVTGAVTAAHIATAVEAASDSNTFTDADHTKLNAIEASADVTDTANVTSAGALMDSELASIAAVKATTGTFLAADETKLDGIATGANNYVHPTTAGNKHIPTGGTVGQILKNTASGTATWQADNTVCTSGTATTAATLATARTIAGVSFNGSANISLNNNAITNGAGYTTNVGDITGVTAGTGMSGGGTSGTVTLTCTIDSPSEVGLGNLSSSGNALSGDFTATGNITAYSDLRLKSNIEVIDDSLAKVMSLRGVNFDMNGERSTGVIAQELEVVLPEAVRDNEDGMKSVAYGNIVGLLIEAIKEQQKQINELRG
jgi:hypothetical protein